MRDIDIRTLRLFIAICEHESMARAAEQEHIEPSAVSKRIAQLEQSLGTALLRRTRRGAHPTDAGLAVLGHARRTLFTLEQMSADAASFGAGVRGHVRLVASASAIAERLLDDIAAFMREPAHRRISLDIEERTSLDLVRHVRDGMASVGVVWDNVEMHGLAQRPYRTDRLALAVHPDHPLAGRRTLRLQQTLDYPHVGLPPPAAMHAMLRRAAARSGRTVDYRVVVSSFDAAFRVVAANLAVSVIPLEVGARMANALGVRLIPLSDAWARRRFAICFTDLAALSPAARRLVEHLQAAPSRRGPASSAATG